MNKFKNYILYLAFALLGNVVISLPGIAHSEGQAWDHHMAGGHWGFVPMIFFWMAGVLLVGLLTANLLKSLRD